MSEERGLYAKYFVLKPRGADAFAAASRRAMFVYAQSIMSENPTLSKEIWDWAGHALLDAEFPDEPLPPAHWRPKGGIELKWTGS